MKTLQISLATSKGEHPEIFPVEPLRLRSVNQNVEALEMHCQLMTPATPTLDPLFSKRLNSDFGEIVLGGIDSYDNEQ